MIGLGSDKNIHRMTDKHKSELNKNSRSREFSTRVSFIFSRSTTRNDFLKSRSRLEIREWSYDNTEFISPGENTKNNSRSCLEKLHLLSRVRVRFYIQPNHRAAQQAIEKKQMIWFMKNNQKDAWQLEMKFFYLGNVWRQNQILQNQWTGCSSA